MNEITCFSFREKACAVVQQEIAFLICVCAKKKETTNVGSAKVLTMEMLHEIEQCNFKQYVDIEMKMR